MPRLCRERLLLWFYLAELTQREILIIFRGNKGVRGCDPPYIICTSNNKRSYTFEVCVRPAGCVWGRSQENAHYAQAQQTRQARGSTPRRRSGRRRSSQPPRFCFFPKGKILSCMVAKANKLAPLRKKAEGAHGESGRTRHTPPANHTPVQFTTTWRSASLTMTKIISFKKQTQKMITTYRLNKLGRPADQPQDEDQAGGEVHSIPEPGQFGVGNQHNKEIGGL